VKIGSDLSEVSIHACSACPQSHVTVKLNTAVEHNLGLVDAAIQSKAIT
jgi:hypothetical protein